MRCQLALWFQSTNCRFLYFFGQPVVGVIMIYIDCIKLSPYVIERRSNKRYLTVLCMYYSFPVPVYYLVKL